MDTRIQNNTDKGFSKTDIHPMPHFSVSFPMWSGPNEQQLSQSQGMHMNPKLKLSPQLQQEAMHLCLQVKDKSSSLSQSPLQSHQEKADSGGTNSRLSSDSGQTQSHSKPEQQIKAYVGQVDVAFNPSHVDYSHIMTHNSYPYGAPQISQFINPYGTHMPPQMVGFTPSRLPLPLDVADEGPIYVNAKQYNGIMRRRQSRAKLEAQNKLVKVRKPYLHESRHQHALNRVRGLGGRFLSKNKLQQIGPPPSHSNLDSTGAHSGGRILDFEVHQPERTTAKESFVSPSNQATQRQPDTRFWSGMFDGIPMQHSGFSGGKKQYASNVR